MNGTGGSPRVPAVGKPSIPHHHAVRRHQKTRLGEFFAVKGRPVPVARAAGAVAAGLLSLAAGTSRAPGAKTPPLCPTGTSSLP